MKQSKHIGLRLLCLALAAVMVLGMLPRTPLTASAAGNYTYEGGAGNKVADLDTSGLYASALGDNTSTEYAGRIWTDKSVFTGDVTFDTFGGGKSTIKLNENKTGEDFLVAYSALATSEAVTGQTQAPVDVVFIIDISGSMSNNNSRMDNGLSRIANTVAAVNTSIETLMAMNEHTRVALVAFSSTAEILLPLAHYTKSANRPFLSLNTTKPGEDAELTVRAVSSSGNVNKTRDVSGGTNIQTGIHTGMNILAAEASVAADVDGQSVPRVPSVVLLSDGAPTYSSGNSWSETSNWWAPLNNDNNGPGGSAYYGNGFKALMTGAYMKNAIDANYNLENANYGTTFYTIGMGISELGNYSGFRYTGEQDLAHITLNPGTFWNEDNDMAEDIVDAWTRYTNQTPGSNSNITVQTDSSETYTVRHPANDIYTATDKDALKNLVDYHYDADNASAVNSVFSQIVSNISVSRPQVPTEVDGSDPITSGYITYTDPIGEYMEVKDVKAILYAGETFTVKNVATSGSTTTYTFAGTIDSPVYGHQEIGNIQIFVTEENGKQTLTVKIPAAVIPLRINEIELNSDDTVKTHTNNGAFPARVIYSVGLQSEIVKKSDSGEVYIDRSKLSGEYLAANTNADGSVNFYSNLYTGTNDKVNGNTVGNAMVNFEPSHSNKFYYILSDMPIYKDAAFTQLVASTGDLDTDLADGTTYYYKDQHYHGSSVEITAVARTGAQLKRTDITVGTDGNLYRAEGSPRLNRILVFEGTKTLNRTQTAEDFYAPAFHDATGGTGYDGHFDIYQGNNGRLSVISGGNLRITKTVTAGDGLTAPDKDFQFKIDLDGANVNQGVYDYAVQDAAGTTIRTGTISQANNTITLKGGQSAIIAGLSPATTYEVTEEAVDGFATAVSGDTGTITAGNTSVAAFTNTYNVTPITFPENEMITGTKVLKGRSWVGGDDSFTFYIRPYNNAPLPAGYNASTGITVSQPTTTIGTDDAAVFSFGTINFTAPGTYRYTIMEKEPENNEYLPGMSYSRALFRLVVTIVDNGDGTLSIASTDLQRLYTDNGDALFTYVNNEIVMNSGEEGQDAIVFVNTFNAQDVVRVPVALKDYTDLSGENPLVSGMFEFKLEALGIVEGGVLQSNTADQAPMPAGAVNNAIITSNEGHNITFPGVAFTQAHVLNNQPTIYQYKMTEVIPNNRVNGMTYDDSEFIINVTVSIDPASGLVVDAVYPENVRIATFRNSYEKEPATAQINGTKTLNGRDMKQGESFAFTLTPNTATSNAITAGDVVVPSYNAAVSGASDGAAKGFAFENLVFKKSGTYIFTVAETAGSAAGVTYDDTVYTVTVVVHDNDNDGVLTAGVTYSHGKTAAEFVNTYSSSFNGTPVSLSGSKELTGKSLLAGAFFFKVERYENGTKVGEGFVTHSADETPDATGTYQGSVKLLDGITFDKPGTYRYIITEQLPMTPVHGTTYDQTKFRYTVVVTDDLNGNLVVSSTDLEKQEGSNWVDAEAVVFKNDYVPTPATATLPLINKVISGDRDGGLKAGEFEFQLSVLSATAADGITLPATTKVSNAANGSIVFDEITFTKAGTYQLLIQEVVPAENKVPGITYSTQTLIAQYRVTDDRIGTLTAVLEGFIGGDSIVNLYKAAPAEAEMEIGKSFTGRNNDEWLSSDEFQFEIEPDADTKTAIANGDIEFAYDANASVATLTIDSKGETVSKVIKVNRIGTYRFTVRELSTNIAGVQYVTDTSSVVITATDDSLNAQIKVAVAADEKTNIAVAGQNTDKVSLTFTNTYAPTATADILLSAEKKVTTTGGAEYDLVGGEFSFTLTGSSGAPMPALTTTVNDANGDVTFGSVAFTQRGVYSYTIQEAQSSLDGITTDGTIYTVTVTVTDNYTDGELEATVAITATTGTASAPANKVVFDNKYDPTEVSAVIFGSKELTGGHKDLEAEEFEFTLEAVTAGAPMPAETTVKNTASGVFQFGSITYDTVGTYTYKVTEKNLGKDGYTYDDRSFEVTVTVTDIKSGVLQASVSGVGTVQNPTIQFVNNYTPTTAQVVLGLNGEIAKDLTGRDLKAEEFEFTVTDGSVVKASGKNDKDGKVLFTLDFDKAGTYTYQITEKDNDLEGVTYDSTVYTVTIVISDVGGQLKADSVVYSLDNTPVNDVVFHNTYKNPEIPKTGDETQLQLWLILTIVSAGAMIVLLAASKKRGQANR